MRSSRRQIRAPVGNKTKRGAELEGTPKTPRSLEIYSVRSHHWDAIQQDRTGTRRPLNWSLSRQGLTAIAKKDDDSAENPVTPSKTEKLRHQGIKAAELALSPLCVNAIDNSNQQGESRYDKLLSEQTLKSPRSQYDLSKAYCFGPDNNTDAIGLYPSSPECNPSPFSGGAEGVVVWSNAAFQPVFSISGRCFSKDSGSSSSHSFASNSKWPLSPKAEVADFESWHEGCGAQQYSSVVIEGSSRSNEPCQFPLEGREICFRENRQGGTMASLAVRASSEYNVGNVGGHRELDGNKSSFIENNLKGEHLGGTFSADPRIELVSASSGRGDEDLFEGSPPSRSAVRKLLLGSIEASDHTADQAQKYVLSRLHENYTELNRQSVQERQASQEWKESFCYAAVQGRKADGMDDQEISGRKSKSGDEDMDLVDIEEEIQRLTVRLAELQSLKQAAARRQAVRDTAGAERAPRKFAAKEGRKRGGVEADGLSRRVGLRHQQVGDAGRRVATCRSPAERAVSVARPSLGGVGGGAGAVEPASRPADQNAQVQPRRDFGFSSSKLREIRSSVKKPEGHSQDRRNAPSTLERPKVLRRLSLRCASGGSTKNESRPLTPNPAAARTVASRFALPSKKRDRDSASSTAQPSRAAASSLAQPPRAADFSSSNSVKNVSTHNARSTSAPRQQPPPAPPPPLLLTPSAARPKSTTALHESLESLLHNRTDFFTRYSPMRSPTRNAVPGDLVRPPAQESSESMMEQLQAIAVSSFAPPPECQNLPFSRPSLALELQAFADGLEVERTALPRIDTSHCLGLSPRDSGCVKRMQDRLNKHSFPSNEEDLQMISESERRNEER